MILGEQAKNHKSICAAHAAVKACVDHCPTLKGQVDKASEVSKIICKITKNFLNHYTVALKYEYHF